MAIPLLSVLWYSERMGRSESEVEYRLNELAGYDQDSATAVSLAVIKFLRKYTKEIAAAPVAVYMYPMGNGGVSLEWRGSTLVYGLEIAPDLTGDYYILSTRAKKVYQDEQIATISGNWFKERVRIAE